MHFKQTKQSSEINKKTQRKTSFNKYSSEKQLLACQNGNHHGCLSPLPSEHLWRDIFH